VLTGNDPLADLRLLACLRSEDIGIVDFEQIFQKGSQMKEFAAGVALVLDLGDGEKVWRKH
jgi:hypothetical protein